MSKRAHLLENESKIRALWQETRVFEANLPANRSKDKYFCTFPYPYMNGRLHIGHGFTVLKSEFQARFQRTQGKVVLWPFGLHCTGMPIMACADKIKKELLEVSKRINKTPQLNSGLSNHRNEDPLNGTENEEEHSAASTKDVTKFSSSRSKLKAKSNTNMTQIDIMKHMNIDDEEIPKFANPDHWLVYFSPLAIQDMKMFGLSVDWRRSFITTNRNPYYNLFVEWQFDRLKRLDKLLYGSRPSIFSRLTMQTCGDHDRSEGEGATAQEYTVIKMKLDVSVKNPFKQFQGRYEHYAEKLKEKSVYLLAATLRPETFYGQTNLFVCPEGEYEAFLGFEAPRLSFNSVGVVETKMALREAVDQSECVYLTSRRSALNMAHQGLTILNEKATPGSDYGEDELFSLQKFTGMDLIGTSVVTPLSVHKSVYVVPMVTASMHKGTGIVGCVPSDSPDDYVVLSEMRRKGAYFKEKYNVLEEYVSLEEVPIIDVPEYGTCMAVKLCNESKVTSPKDHQKLEELKEFVYKKGFYTGVINVGPYKDQKVVDVKNKIRDEMIRNKQAFMYYEPSKNVVSRSGDVCVVAICNQWYTKFGDEEWKKNVMEQLKRNNFTCYSESSLNQMKHVINWLDNWACSRSYGLGTLLPWEDITKNRNILIDSLSDSTIYMAYYTVAHYLQSDIFGNKPGLLNMSAERLNKTLFDYVFNISDKFPTFNDKSHGTDGAGSDGSTDGTGEKIDKQTVETINQMREEFKYWYPVDVRCSGKDLLFNHLTMSLFIHEAIWRGCSIEYMPRSFFCNGHVLVDSEKMSKSKGNFLTIEDSINLYTADGTRIAMADAGDSLDDANFSKETAESSVLKLFNFLQTSKNDMATGTAIGLERSLNEMEEELKDGLKLAKGPKLNGYIESNDLNLFSRAVFENEIKNLCDTAKRCYENFVYRDALKAVFYDYIAIRLEYLQLSNAVTSYESLRKYYETFCVIANPIVPHMCEYIWNYVLNKKEHLTDQLWPRFEKPTNKSLHKLLKLLHRNLEEFRKTKEKSQSSKKSKVAQTFDKALIYISREYPENIRNVIVVMNEMKILESNMTEKEALKKLNESEMMRSCSPKDKKVLLGFASYQLKQLFTIGQSVLMLHLPYSEYKLYQLLEPYLKTTLEVKGTRLCRILTIAVR
ncbi:leucyl-tRNA synthetase [Theileria orientalis strain Shintoku]|uniref:leucine--tRNA ligase n=1 Tax=Theileria orientalis strain Shintoku TaxID=869250 RepID=J4DAG2_THEOR|nr:leucyl-tRNA synthetase [Theileria orientalis strain Shintoku]BAM41960.1 leucyl-tRNA synthetase [Theileria orientalis strain Shintoku]|eukprot:XP_009692261.1 leucyl-tRNA synthetase [Theileria orientalis strain Shintoku]